jgi:hypothetical protein
MILGDKNVNVRYVSNSGVYSPLPQLPQQRFYPDGKDTVYEEYYRLNDGRVVKKVIRPRGCQVAYTGNLVCDIPEERSYYVKDIPQMPVAPGQPVTVYPTEIVPVAVQAPPPPPKATRNTHVDPEEIPGKRREEIDGMPIQYGNESVGDSPCVGSSKECAKRANSIVN